MADNFGYYNILGVNQDASSQEIKDAYRELAKKYHPDISNDPDCVRKFREVNEAYQFLKDQKQRTIYNTQYTSWGKFSRDENYRTRLDQIIINLINSLNNPNSLMRNYAVDALVRIGTPAFEPVLRATQSNDEIVRRKTCDILGRMGRPDGVIPLIMLLNDPDGYVRRRAAKALILVGDQRAVVPLINALQDTEKKVRSRSAKALGRIGDRRAVRPLIKSLNDPKSRVRRSAISALGQIGDYQAVGPITRCLTDENTRVRTAAKKTLKYQFNIGDEVDPRDRLSDDICPNCSNPVLPHTKFCIICGASLNQKAGICPKCASPTLPHANFCMYCGASIKK